MSAEHAVDERVLWLRELFDASFARSRHQPREEERDFLSFRFGDEGFALPVSELLGLEKGRKLVRLPAAPAGCRGLAGVRGKLVAVFDLAALLGLSPTAELRWLLLPRASQGVAVGVTAVEHYLRVPHSAILPREGAGRDPCVATLLHAGATLRVLSLERLLHTLSPRAPEPAP